MNGAIIALSLCYCSCTNSNNQTNNDSNMEATTIPTADKFVSSPLRNRIKLELNVPISEVWALVGNPGRMPEYSEGLDKVETKTDKYGNCTEFLCHFKPQEPGGQGIEHRCIIKWYEPLKGWASLDEEPNVFGFQQSLTLITFETKDGKTILTWDMHFNAENKEALQMNISSLEQALNKDIVQRLIDKFGGKLIESYVEGK